MIPRVTAGRSLFVVVDFQVGHIDRLRTATGEDLVRTIGALCTAAKYLDVPVLLTGAELHGSRPAFAGNLDASEAIWRSTADAFDSKGFTEAIAASGRRTIVFAGVATDIGGNARRALCASAWLCGDGRTRCVRREERTR